MANNLSIEIIELMVLSKYLSYSFTCLYPFQLEDSMETEETSWYVGYFNAPNTKLRYSNGSFKYHLIGNDRLPKDPETNRHQVNLIS